MLKHKLFAAFMALALLLGALSAVFGIWIIQRQVIGEAQKRVRLDLASAWAVMGSAQSEMETVLRLVADGPTLTDAARSGDWDRPALQERLSRIVQTYSFDFLTLCDSSGVSRRRADASRETGDDLSANPAVASARLGQSSFGLLRLDPDGLAREHGDLPARAAIPVRPTARARASTHDIEPRGLLLVGAVPVVENGRQLGILYGGRLLNRSSGMVDQIRDLVYRETYRGQALGTATIFLDDVRIATTVLTEAGERAIGTRASAEVADRVLRDKQSWIGRAFVVRDWYLTAYDPMKDLSGNTVGILYVGLLEQPFNDLRRSTTIRYGLLLLLGVVGAMALSFWIAARLARPIHSLVLAAGEVARVPEGFSLNVPGGCREIDRLIRAFNEMAAALEERDRHLLAARQTLEEANRSLETLNRGYLDMLGFVSHELKLPVSSLQNYVHLLSTEKLGPIEERQRKALDTMTRNVEWITEMVRHYLGLARIEAGEIEALPERVLLSDVLQMVLDSLHSNLQARNMRVDLELPDSLAVQADPRMTREILENLLSNAVKYGCDGGRILVSARPSGEAPGWIEIVAGNEGAGVPEDRLDDLFRKFSPLHMKTRSKMRGTGLGLYITRHHVEAHGGTISVRTEPGRWIEFRFTLPAAPVSP